MSYFKLKLNLRSGAAGVAAVRRPLIFRPPSARYVAALLSLCFLLFSVGLTLGLFDAAEAEKEKSVEEQLSQSVEDELDKLDTDLFQEFVDSLNAEEKNALLSSGIKDAIQMVLSGKMTSPKEFFSQINRAFFKALLGFLPAMLTIVIICVMKSILSGMTSGFKQQSTIEIVHYVCYSAVVVIAMAEVAGVVGLVVRTVNGLKNFSSAIFPPLLTLVGALGGVVSAGVYQPLMVVFTSLILELITTFIVPIFLATVVFAAVGSLSKNVKLEKLTALTRTIAEWVLGIVFSVFIAFLTVQGAVGAAADKVTVNAAKFALSSYVPILGGYLSQGFDLVYASCVLIKNALGYTGLTVLLAIVMLPIAKLATLLLTMRLTAAVVEPLGEDRISNFMVAVSKNLLLLITAIVGAAFLFFVLLLIIIMSINVL
ncbi:MAG TPA: stage III sporulation protein AE [Eubacteriales bacterium]|jgi:stage III sporulation protein AE|nr:stage III sporulation protein AE [Eubacteriales bacterium]HRU84493.1 stage III sporulation protein AE [Eubacteriales bacterium]